MLKVMCCEKRLLHTAQGYKCLSEVSDNCFFYHISCGCNVFNSRLYFGEPMEWGSHKMSLGTASFTFLFVNKLNPRQISKHGLGFAKSF